MDGRAMAGLFAMSFMVTEKNLDGIDEAAALRSPDSGGNCVNWILGHLLSVRNHALRAVGAEPVWDQETADGYSAARGKSWEPGEALPLGRIRSDLETSQERLTQALGEMSESDLERPLGDSTVGGTLHLLQIHETYHAGQIGLSRRLLGMPGVIEPPERVPTG